MTRHNTLMDEMAGGSLLLSGEIVFDEDSPSFEKASVHIYLEDTTLADASAKVVLHHILENITADMVQNKRIPFALNGTIPDTQADYAVRVLVDVDGDGKISRNDYISTVSYPVLTHGYPNRVIVQVRKMR
jgi:uncharacterized protein (DUF2141 family)